MNRRKFLSLAIHAAVGAVVAPSVLIADNPHVLTLEQICKTADLLKAAKVKGPWLIMFHPDVERDIRALPGFVPVASYGSRTKLLVGEIGSVSANYRFVESPL